MKLDHRILGAETGSSHAVAGSPRSRSSTAPSAKVRLRVLSVGAGPSLVMLHGVTLAAAVWCAARPHATAGVPGAARPRTQPGRRCGRA